MTSDDAGTYALNARATLRYGFEHLRFERVIGRTHPNNAASKRVLAKLGMRFRDIEQHPDGTWEVYAATRPGA